MSVLIKCEACGRQVSTAAKQCMNCGHPVVNTAPHTWLWIVLAAGMFLVVAAGAYRILPILFNDSPKTTTGSSQSSRADDSRFGVNALPDTDVAYMLPPSGGRVASKRELSEAAQKLNAAAVPYWNHIYKVERIYYNPKEHNLEIRYLVREAFQDVDKSMLLATHRSIFCNSTAHAIFRLSGVSAQWSFRADRGNELMYAFKVIEC